MKAPAAPEFEYFRAIEDAFIRLRGAPFLLSPADWRLAQGWFDARIPLDVIREALEEVFERRVERGESGKVQSLRYCAAAVEAAWRERRELGSTRPDGEAPALDVEARLDSLAAALPSGLEDRARWVERIRGAAGDPRDAEERLADLDRRLVEECSARLDAETRRGLESAVEEALSELSDRLAPEVLVVDRRRLLRERMRREAGLPLLSLFSPDAVSR